MNGVKSIESVVFMELMNTIRLSFMSVKQDVKSRKLWANQVAYFKKVVQFYLLDLDIKEFKDLRLPSEQKSKTKQPKTRSKRQPVKPRFRTGGKQLQLFFIKATKQGILIAVIVIESVVKELEFMLMKNSREFQNRLRQ